MGQLNALLQLIVSPLGMILIATCAFAFFYSQTQKLGRWIVLGALIFCASLSRYVNEWVQYPPPFWGPIDVFVQYGRPITIALIVLALTIATGKSKKTRFPMAVTALVCCHLVIAFKIFLQGSMSFAALVFVSELLILALFYRISSTWFDDRSNIEFAIFAVFVSTVMFVSMNFFQFVVDPSPQVIAHGRFNGTTGNPQHAAAFLGCAVPATTYVLLASKKKLVRIAALMMLFAVLYFLSLTGSRTGLVLAALSLTLVFRRQRGAISLVTIGSIVVLGGAFFFMNDTAIEKIAGFEDTRTHVWAAMWRSFLTNPIFGADLIGDRLGYGENSWLAIASATGMLGLLPLVLFGALAVKLSLGLLSSNSGDKKTKLQRDALGATIICLLLGSVFEAYLLSGLSSPSLIVSVAVIAGSKMREREKRRSFTRKVNTFQKRMSIQRRPI